MLAKINSELETVLKTEADARDRAREEQLQRALESAGGGAFPVLPGSAHPTHPNQAAQPHKVLSLNAKTKKVLVSTTISRPITPPAPSPSAAALAAEEQELEDVISPEIRKTRVVRPTDIPEHGVKVGTERRWEPVQGGGAHYVQPPSLNQVPGGSSGGGRKKHRAKNKTVEAPPS